jgi:FkbM family methyltransferase
MLQVKLIRILIDLVERLLFNPHLKDTYQEIFKDKIETFVDVGVNTGQTIDLILKLNPQCTIYGFEPNPKLFSELQIKYSRKKNVNLLCKGVSSETGSKLFYENLLHSTSSFEELNESSKYLKRKSNLLGVSVKDIISDKYEVPVTSLHDFIIEHKIEKPIDLVKIDSEGHEFHCISGLLKNKDSFPKYIQFEFHFDDMYKNNNSFSEIESVLTENKYVLIKEIKHPFGKFSDFIFGKTVGQD